MISLTTATTVALAHIHDHADLEQNANFIAPRVPVRQLGNARDVNRTNCALFMWNAARTENPSARFCQEEHDGEGEKHHPGLCPSVAWPVGPGEIIDCTCLHTDC